MPPRDVKRIFYRALVTEPEPANVDLELTVLGKVAAEPAVAAWAVPFLSVGDFTDRECRRRFAAVKREWKMEPTRTASADSYDVVMRLRRLTAERTARQLAWRFVRSAHNMSPEKFADYVIERLGQFRERLGESGLGGSNGLQVEHGQSGKAAGSTTERKGTSGPPRAGKDEQPGKAV